MMSMLVAAERVFVMYEKNKTNRVTLRLTDAQMSFVRTWADRMQQSPSDFLRMLIDSNRMGFEIGADWLEKNGKDGVRRENEQTCIDDKL